jgi:hypothetical protein
VRPFGVVELRPGDILVISTDAPEALWPEIGAELRATLGLPESVRIVMWSTEAGRHELHPLGAIRVRPSSPEAKTSSSPQSGDAQGADPLG